MPTPEEYVASKAGFLARLWQAARPVTADELPRLPTAKPVTAEELLRLQRIRTSTLVVEYGMTEAQALEFIRNNRTPIPVASFAPVRPPIPERLQPRNPTGVDFSIVPKTTTADVRGIARSNQRALQLDLIDRELSRPRMEALFRSGNMRSRQGVEDLLEASRLAALDASLSRTRLAFGPPVGTDLTIRIIPLGTATVPRLRGLDVALQKPEQTWRQIEDVTVNNRRRYAASGLLASGITQDEIDTAARAGRPISVNGAPITRLARGRATIISPQAGVEPVLLSYNRQPFSDWYRHSSAAGRQQLFNHLVNNLEDLPKIAGNGYIRGYINEAMRNAAAAARSAIPALQTNARAAAPVVGGFLAGLASQRVAEEFGYQFGFRRDVEGVPLLRGEIPLLANFESSRQYLENYLAGRLDQPPTGRQMSDRLQEIRNLNTARRQFAEYQEAQAEFLQRLQFQDAPGPVLPGMEIPTRAALEQAMAARIRESVFRKATSLEELVRGAAGFGQVINPFDYSVFPRR